MEEEDQDFAFGTVPGVNGKNGVNDRRLYGDIFPRVPAWDTRNMLLAQYSRNPDIRALIEDMPSQTQCVALIRAYLAGYHTVMPLFHSPTFWQQVRESYHL
jgi:hypothetical protein